MKALVRFLYELGQLKTSKRTGWWFTKVKDPESIADHVYRTSVLGFLLGKMEKANAERCMMICLVHDNQEARTLDFNKVAARYIQSKEAENIAFSDQVADLPAEIKDEFLALYKEYAEQKTKEAIIAKDADLLECAFTAKEHIEIGYTDCEDWIKNAESLLKTASAKKMMQEMKKTKSSEWYLSLKKISR